MLEKRPYDELADEALAAIRAIPAPNRDYVYRGADGQRRVIARGHIGESRARWIVAQLDAGATTDELCRVLGVTQRQLVALERKERRLQEGDSDA